MSEQQGLRNTYWLAYILLKQRILECRKVLQYNNYRDRNSVKLLFFFAKFYLYVPVLSQRSDGDLSSTIGSSSFGGTGRRLSILLFFEVQAHIGDESKCIIVFDVFDTEFLVWFFFVGVQKVDLLPQSTLS